MSRSTPQQAFATVQAAIGSQDWDTFFASLDAASVRRIAKNGLTRLGRDDRVEALCREAGVEQPLLERVKELAARMAAAAQATLAGGTEESLRLKALVEDHQTALAAVLQSAANLVSLTAALERDLRAAHGGGSVSSSLFVGETLEDVGVEGDEAWGVRRNSRGLTTSVGFVRRQGSWLVRLFSEGGARAVTHHS